MSELAYRKGLLNQADMNSVQEALLSVVLRRKRKEEIDLEVAKFEQNLFINNPSLYKDYMNNKEQEEINGNKNIEWMTPDSVEEANQLMDLFRDIDKQLKEENDQPAAQIDFLSALGGINLDEIGGDE